jgi:acyl-CoA hydrolase
VQLVNAPHVIEQNHLMTTINGALAVDIHGQVVADNLGGAQYSGIGGAEDFTSGPGFKAEQRALLCLPSTVEVGGELRSRILPWFEAGTVITTPRHQVDVIVTEYGAAELEAKTVRQRGQALAAVAHPGLPRRAARGGGPRVEGALPAAAAVGGGTLLLC